MFDAIVAVAVAVAVSLQTYNLNFYLQYLAQWPEYFLVHEAPEGRLTSYGEVPQGL